MLSDVGSSYVIPWKLFNVFLWKDICSIILSEAFDAIDMVEHNNI